MKILGRSPTVRALAFTGLLVLCSGLPLGGPQSAFGEEAASGEPPAAQADNDDSPTLKTQAERLHAEASDIRRAAEQARAGAEQTCWQKFMVSQCLDDAGQTYRNEKARAAGLDSQARSIERELKRREIADKAAQRAAQRANKEAQQKP